MRRRLAAVVWIAAWVVYPVITRADSQKILLNTAEGVKAVKGEWRYSDVKIVESEGKGADGKPNKTYNIEPKAFGANFDDSKWEVIDPTTLKKPRSTGQVCFNWYRIKVTLPDDVPDKQVFFQTTVDDYGEIWVDGRLPRTGGQVGGSIVAGFNAPNRVELPDPKPGKVYQIAVFGINGPISAAPGNRIFLHEAFLEFVPRKE
jgi:hypothetical protein